MQPAHCAGLASTNRRPARAAAQVPPGAAVTACSACPVRRPPSRAQTAPPALETTFRSLHPANLAVRAERSPWPRRQAALGAEWEGTRLTLRAVMRFAHCVPRARTTHIQLGNLTALPAMLVQSSRCRASRAAALAPRAPFRRPARRPARPALPAPSRQPLGERAASLPARASSFPPRAAIRRPRAPRATIQLSQTQRAVSGAPSVPPGPARLRARPVRHRPSTVSQGQRAARHARPRCMEPAAPRASLPRQLPALSPQAQPPAATHLASPTLGPRRVRASAT
jgi:hypothetical protein